MNKPFVHLYPHVVQTKLGPALAAEWGQLSVPENRAAAGSRKIAIPFVRFRCTSENPGSPVIFLQGGPGTSVLTYLPLIWNMPVMKPPIDLADCIFIEHRGFGMSRPSLDCPGSYDIPLNLPGNPELYREAHRPYLANSLAFWQEQDVDIAGYNAREMAQDIDDLRRALGYDKISLYGGSFGSHHGFALLRCFGQHIERAFLWDIEGPNHTVKLPGNIQRQLIRLNSYVQDDLALSKLIPDLLDLMGVVIDRLRQPVVAQAIHPQTEEMTDIAIGAYDLQLVTANGLGNARFLSEMPRRYLHMTLGDYSWLAEQVMRLRVNQTSNLMYETTDLASGATVKRKEQIAQEAEGTLLGDAINESFHALGDILGSPDMGDDFRGRLISEVPIMLVGGSLDARTPISNAEELLPDLKNGRLIKVNGASHDIAVRGAHCEQMARYRDQFLQGQEPTVSELDAKFSFQQFETIK